MIALGVYTWFLTVTVFYGSHIASASFPSSYELGLEVGNWVEYEYLSETSTVDPYSKIEVVVIVGPPKTSISIRREFYFNARGYENETASAGFPIIPEDYNWVTGMVIPKNSEVGDTIITGHPGNIYPNHNGLAVILDETTGDYAGVIRSVLHVSFSTLGTDWDYCYDKQTGIMVQETRTTILFGTETVKAVRTNMWQAVNLIPSPTLNADIILILIAVIVIAVILALFLIVVKFKLKAKSSLEEALDDGSSREEFQFMQAQYFSARAVFQSVGTFESLVKMLYDYTDLEFFSEV